MFKKMIPGLLLLLMLLSNSVFAAPKVNAILRQIDDRQELRTDGICKIMSTQQKVGQGVKVTQMIYYRRDSDDSFLIVLTAPEVEKGNGYLKKGDNMWMYRRNTRSFQHVNRDESISGSDAKTEDFENKKLVELYKPVLKGGKEVITETKLGNKSVYQFEIVAKTENVAYPKRIYWVEKTTFLPLKVQSFSLNGTLMETAYFPKYMNIQGKYLFAKAIFIDEFEKGNRTIIELSNFTVRKIDNKVFTKAYLENLSK